MADVQECIAKLVATGTITKSLGEEALEMFRRSKAEYSRELGPASADAAAALEAAKKLRDKAAERQISIAASVKTWRAMEQRIVADPRGGLVSLTAMSSKDTALGDNLLNDLRKTQPDHPIFEGKNVGSLTDVLHRSFYNSLGEAMEKFRPGFLKNTAEIMRSADHFIDERFGVSTGDIAAKTVSDAFGDVVGKAQDRAIQAGKIFEPSEDWRVPQPWTPRRVAAVSQQFFVDRFQKWIDAGGLKLWDKEKNTPAALADYDPILRKAYADIKTQGGTTEPFSKDMRTFRFQPGQIGAAAWKDLQATFGVGNEIMSMVDQHLGRMAREIALREVFGPNPEAAFAAGLRLALEKNPGVNLPAGLRWLASERTARLTFDVAAGKGHPVANEVWARRMSAARNLVGVASLRNLPITIVPSDTLMTFFASAYDHMSGFNVISHIFDGASKDIARHLQISAHGYIDYALDTVRRYEDEINYSGLARKVSRAVVKATGAQLWTENGRLGSQLAPFNILALARHQTWNELDPVLRENFFGYRGFTEADWNKIRAVEPYSAQNGAQYMDLPKLTEMDRALSERLQMAVSERSSYLMHQPDARSVAIAGGSAPRGSFEGEAALSFFQYKQFGLERISTHLMRILRDGPIENRAMRGLAYTALSMAAGAVSLQAAAVLAGENPLNMRDPKFWLRSFVRGGAGGVYGDVLGAAFQGDRGLGDLLAQMAGPVPGIAYDAGKVIYAPFKQEFFDQEGRSARTSAAGQFVAAARRWQPGTWYTKLAVDRLFLDKLQILLDPNYRASFRRTEQNAKKQGTSFWWQPGESAPQSFHGIGR